MNIYLESILNEREKEEILKDLKELKIDGVSSISISKDDIGAARYKDIDYIINLMGKKESSIKFDLQGSEDAYIWAVKGQLKSITFKKNNKYIIEIEE